MAKDTRGHLAVGPGQKIPRNGFFFRSIRCIFIRILVRICFRVGISQVILYFTQPKFLNTD